MKVARYLISLVAVAGLVTSAVGCGKSKAQEAYNKASADTTAAQANMAALQKFNIYLTQSDEKMKQQADGANWETFSQANRTEIGNRLRDQIEIVNDYKKQQSVKGLNASDNFMDQSRSSAQIVLDALNRYLAKHPDK